MANKKVVITFDEQRNLVPVDPAEMKIRRSVTAALGDVIRWESPHGDVKINFPKGSPFGARKKFRGHADLRVQSLDGSFTYRCGITLRTGEHIGWPGPTTPRSGGVVKIVRER